MKKTIAILAFFVAAILAGLFVRATGAEHFMQKEKGMPLDMEPVENAVGVAGYNGTPPLLGSEPKPVSEKPYDMANDNELFQFESNQISPDCCPSSFTTDRGCICLTDAQRREFATRGGNAS